MDDIAKLAKYLYTNCSGRKEKGDGGEIMDPIRKQVTNFIADNFVDFRGPAAKELQSEGGYFAIDLIEGIQQAAKIKKEETPERRAVPKIAGAKRNAARMASTFNLAANKKGRPSK